MHEVSVTVGWIRIPRQTVQQSLGDRPRDHRHTLVGAALLRDEAVMNPTRKVRCAVYTLVRKPGTTPKAIHSTSLKTLVTALH